jgi:hypothetical protein
MMALAVLRALAFGGVGFALAAVHFAALRLNADLYLARTGRGHALGLHAVRMALTLAAWLAIAHFGAVSLLSAFGGMLLGRRAVVHRLAVPR